MVGSRFAPPQLFTAISSVAPKGGIYPEAPDDEAELAFGTHLRIYAGLGASFPLAPFAAYRTRSQETEGIDIDVTGGTKIDSSTFSVDEGLTAEVTLILPPRETSRYLRMDLQVEGDIKRIALIDQRGRQVEVRNRPPWMFAAPTLHRLRVDGRASIRIVPREISLGAILQIDPPDMRFGLLGLPVVDPNFATSFEANWYAGVHTREQGLQEVVVGAPQRLTPMDTPGADLLAVDSGSEQARIARSTDQGITDTLLRMLGGEVPPWLSAPDQLGEGEPLGPKGRSQQVHAPPLNMLQMAAIDPGLARYLGFAACRGEFPDLAGDGRVSRWDSLAVIGLVAYDPGEFERLGADVTPLRDDDESDLMLNLIAQEMSFWGIGTDQARRMLDERIAFARANGYAAAPFVTATAAVLSPRPPRLPKPETVRHYWQRSDGLQPSALYRAGFAFPGNPLSALTALGRDVGDGFETTHERQTELGSDPDWRAVPRLLGLESEPNSRLNRTKWTSKPQRSAALLSDKDIPAAAGTVQYLAYASDPFGRFGAATAFPLDPPPRPHPPTPVLRYEVKPGALPAGDGLASPGVLSVTVVVPPAFPDWFTPAETQLLGRKTVVPRLDNMAPGSLPIGRLEIYFDGQLWSPPLDEPGEQVHEFELPALLPQGTGEPVVTATYYDTDNVASPPDMQRVPVHDRRPPPVIDSAVGLFWTSAPGPAPDVQVKLVWSGPANGTYRVYLADARGMGFQFPPGTARAAIAEAVCEAAAAGPIGERRNFRLLTADAVKADAAGTALFTATLPRSLNPVQFLRIVPLGPGGSEPDFTRCGIVPVAVPESRYPSPPQLDGAVDPATGLAALSVTTLDLDLAALRQEEPGLFQAGAAGANPPEFRLRRAVGSVADPLYARICQSGALERVPDDGQLAEHFAATLADVEAGPLVPFVRYAYWAEIRLPAERRFRVGAVPVEPAGITAPDAAARAAHPRPFSLASAPRILTHLPQDLPAEPADVTVIRTVIGADTRLDITIPNPPQTHPKAVGRYRLALWLQRADADITAAPDADGNWPVIEQGTLSRLVTGLAADMEITVLMAYVDPAGRMGPRHIVPVP